MPLHPPTITVVIPTLDRATTLRSAIQSCVSQDALDWILVSDNSSTDDTPDVVAKFHDPRVRYVRAPQRMSMTQHWEFALSHVDTDFLMFLGDDDALMPRFGSFVRTALSHDRPDAVMWRRAEYHWPDHPVPEWRGYGYFQLGNFCHKVDVRRRVKQVFRFSESYIRLPGVYHALVARQILTRARNHIGDGSYFHTANPDVFSAVVNASLSPRCVELGMPLTVNAAAARSNGTLCIVDPEHSVTKEFFESSDAPCIFSPTGLTTAAVAETLHIAAQIMPPLGRIARVLPERYLVGSVDAMTTHHPSWQRREQATAVLRDYAKRAGKENFYNRLQRRIPLTPPSLALKEGITHETQTRCVRFDGATVRTAWEAAIAIDRLLGLSSVSVGPASRWGERLARWTKRLRGISAAAYNLCTPMSGR